MATQNTNARKRIIRKIILHCTATPDGEDFTVDQIRKWHLDRGFKDIGYHWIVYRDGSVHAGRQEAIAGAHTSNHNYDSIGVCYVGGCDNRLNPHWKKRQKTPAHLNKKTHWKNSLRP